MKRKHPWPATAGLAVALAGALAASPALAHHSTAVFDMEHTVNLNGTVKEFQWTQPHIWIVFSVPNASGGVDDYGVEGMSPSYLGRNGWDKRTLKPGDKVTLTVHPLKDGRKGGFNASVIFPDGKVMYNLPPRPAGAPAPARP